MHDRIRAARVDEGPQPRRELVEVERPSRKGGLRTVEVRPQLLRAPSRAPLLVVLVGAAQDHARVVRGTAAEYARSKLRPVLLVVPLPAVRVERERASVEHVSGPAAICQGPVVGAGLDQADASARILAQTSGEDAARGPSPRDATSWLTCVANHGGGYEEAMADPVDKAKELVHAVEHPVETAKELEREAEEGSSPRTPLIVLSGITLFLSVIFAVLLALSLTLYFVYGGK